MPRERTIVYMLVYTPNSYFLYRPYHASQFRYLILVYKFNFQHKKYISTTTVLDRNKAELLKTLIRGSSSLSLSLCSSIHSVFPLFWTQNPNPPNMGLAIGTLPWKTIAKEALNRTLPFTNLLCCLHITNTYLFTPALVVGPSMVPTFSLTGDLVLAERLSPRRGTVGKGDIVLVRSPENPRKVITKRVVAVEGEAVGGGGVVVPKGFVWIVGDNVDNSRDSRHFGAVPVGLVVGRVFWRVAPWEGFGPVGGN
ncbi:hypothetical protein Syun_027287 [Stephania yunnanensis]|uniref:Peptidase S26 domain-containing protein n=1 Tax=Stephania yunnanensis TaxID=152371 RepID=A0AAP0EFD2_9MAGN